MVIMLRESRYAGAALLACVALACDGSGSRAGDADARVDTGDAGSGNRTLDRGGWVAVSGYYPALVRRAQAEACPDGIPTFDQCRTDAECGPGAACACGGPDGFGSANSCIPAECRSDADCDGRACLLSLGSSPNNCCTFGNLGLFCEREASTCAANDYCPGNGIACIYSAQADHFECQLWGCSCS